MCPHNSVICRYEGQWWLTKDAQFLLVTLIEFIVDQILQVCTIFTYNLTGSLYLNTNG
jgi:hypothetical protein